MEYGDWQTPIELARKVCEILVKKRISPASLVEPTFGTGSFLIAAIDAFPALKNVLGSEINHTYYESAKNLLNKSLRKCNINLIQGDFFTVDWKNVIKSLPEPILITGNPPWVTNTKISTLGSKNLPKKSNYKNHQGIEAITGKSNFDISESIIVKMLEAIEGKEATIAVLCKTDVARKGTGDFMAKEFSP